MSVHSKVILDPPQPPNPPKKGGGGGGEGIVFVWFSNLKKIIY